MTRVLSVEDDPEFQQLLSLALRAEGCRVDYAFSGTEGYEKALSGAPDLVICDLMMPGMNGPELIAKLKESPATREIPVIVTTAYYNAPALVEAQLRRQGALEYLRKPVAIDELIATVRRLLKQAPERPPPPQGASKGRLRLDPATRSVWLEDRLLGTLPRHRFAVLQILAQAKGPVARAALMTKLWPGGAGRARLDKTIERLRRDLGEAAELLRTAPGGYELAG